MTKIQLAINKTLGLIAGKGDLPMAVAGSKDKGTPFAFGLEPLAETLGSYVDEMKWINVGKFGKLINGLKKSGSKRL